jgi:hypothetical protein
LNDISTKEALNILGLSIPFLEDELKSAYRAKVKKCHPDRYLYADHKIMATKLFIKVNSAYEHLKYDFNMDEVLQELKSDIQTTMNVKSNHDEEIPSLFGLLFRKPEMLGSFGILVSILLFPAIFIFGMFYMVPLLPFMFASEFNREQNIEKIVKSINGNFFARILFALTHLSIIVLEMFAVYYIIVKRNFDEYSILAGAYFLSIFVLFFLDFMYKYIYLEIWRVKNRKALEATV